MPDENAMSTKWKRCEALKKINNLECHCQDDVIEIVVHRYPGKMKLLETPIGSLQLKLLVQHAFTHIMNNITDI